ncbi:MAG: hypothetical protein WC438_03350 [Candidatus Pacearchaeota archaeon]
MVNQLVNIRDKHQTTKLFFKFLGILVIIGILIFLIYYAIYGLFFKETDKIILENPTSNIVLKYAGVGNNLNEEQTQEVINEALLEFNKDYINYILVALGIHNLHKSPTFENPKIEILLGEDVWSSEIIKGVPNTQNSWIDDEDIKITLSKEEAVKAILSSNIESFIRKSVSNGNIKIEMIAGKPELFGKGYLTLYKDLTGEEIEV